MHINPAIPLALGMIAGLLFLAVFVAAWLITFRNRRRIKSLASRQEANL